MISASTSTALHYFSDLYSNNRALSQIEQNLSKRDPTSTLEDMEQSIHDYKDAIQIIKDEMWSNYIEEINETIVNKYQQLYRELEQLISFNGEDHRPRFIITIPVADRPKHLQSCLESLLTLCKAFQYGGNVLGRYPKIMVLIADDSKEEVNISRNYELAKQLNSDGIDTIYFGMDEQLQQIDRLDETERNALRSILGDIDRAAFYHKGASIMRNIAYLKLRELTANDENTLCYFIDSDQEFRVKTQTLSGEHDLFAISFFHDLEQIFSQKNITILTGKVVGDPPVSPSVMAGNFLEDVIAFLHKMAEFTPETSCQFHDHDRQRVNEASYHDMADLFGFKAVSESYHYNCTLTKPHTHVACFNDFAHKLNRFFDGEHPTRKSYYEYTSLLSSVTPARTIYTGNYIFRPLALEYFIPFATLKLRMAGPVLGRIIKAEMGSEFVSANLPMLHKRTINETGESEFRPGINREQSRIDLSGEFERQFFGDVMLFALEKLTTAGYPQKSLSESAISETAYSIEKNLRQKYINKQKQIIQKISLLKETFNQDELWWNSAENLEDVENAKNSFTQFINNIEHNFGSSARAYALISSETQRTQRLHDIVTAIAHYDDARSNWQSVLENQISSGRL